MNITVDTKKVEIVGEFKKLGDVIENVSQNWVPSERRLWQVVIDGDDSFNFNESELSWFESIFTIHFDF